MMKFVLLTKWMIFAYQCESLKILLISGHTNTDRTGSKVLPKLFENSSTCYLVKHCFESIVISDKTGH